jgi:hypothetical protein
MQVLYKVHKYKIWIIYRVYMKYINVLCGQYTEFLFCTTGGANGCDYVEQNRILILPDSQ